MKLQNHITIRLSGVFIITLLVWSVAYFYWQMTEIHDGIDEGLNNLKQEFVYKANNSPGFMSDMEKHMPLNIIIEHITYEEALDFQEIFSNSKVYFVTEEEEEEVRMLTTAFYCEQDKEYYKVKFFTSTVESDDLIKNMLYLLLALWVCLGVAIAVVIKTVIHKSNKPFYQLLENLNGFRLKKTKMIDFPSTNISEYKQLNESIRSLLENNINAFNEQKNFIENASHELQTPLMIVAGKIELMMGSGTLSREQMEEMSAILSTLNRMRRLNSTLLLLSKIKNKQFTGDVEVNLNSIFKETAEEFTDLIEHKGITLEIEEKGNTIVFMDKDLAYILANNLIKNAVFHNMKGGKLEVIISEGTIIIKNDGEAIADNVNIFDRYTSNSGSTGLGLSIVKSIADVYKFRLAHQYKDHKHMVVLRTS